MELGFYEERYMSLLEIYKIDQNIESLYKAIQLIPNRFEAPYQLMKYFNQIGWFQMSWFIGNSYINREIPTNFILFVDQATHNYLLDEQILLAAYYAGKFDEFHQVCKRLYSKIDKVASWDKNRIIKNIKFDKKHKEYIDDE